MTQERMQRLHEQLSRPINAIGQVHLMILAPNNQEYISYMREYGDWSKQGSYRYIADERDYQGMSRDVPFIMVGSRVTAHMERMYNVMVGAGYQFQE